MELLMDDVINAEQNMAKKHKIQMQFVVVNKEREADPADQLRALRLFVYSLNKVIAKRLA